MFQNEQEALNSCDAGCRCIALAFDKYWSYFGKSIGFLASYKSRVGLGSGKSWPVLLNDARPAIETKRCTWNWIQWERAWLCFLIAQIQFYLSMASTDHGRILFEKRFMACFSPSHLPFDSLSYLENCERKSLEKWQVSVLCINCCIKFCPNCVSCSFKCSVNWWNLRLV